MSKKVVPMIHVPDVRATVDWYDGATIIFQVEAGQTVGLKFIQDGHENHLDRIT